MIPLPQIWLREALLHKYRSIQVVRPARTIQTCTVTVGPDLSAYCNHTRPKRVPRKIAAPARIALTNEDHPPPVFPPTILAMGPANPRETGRATAMLNSSWAS